jgi:cyanophycinase-like exopeptidase
MSTRGPDPLLRSALQGAGVPRPTVAYVGAASGDNKAFFLIISRMLKAAGAAAVTLAPLCGRRADPAAARDIISSSDVVFISGGDVEEGMSVLSRAKLLPFLRKLHRGGKVFLGVSAGSIMLARSWVRWRDPKDDASAEIFSCMDFAPVLCDTHGEGDGWAELKALLALAPVGTTGYGIVSGSDLVVAAGGRLRAAGGEVHVFRRGRSGVTQRPSLVPGPGKKG